MGARSSRFDPDDDRWLEQVSLLYRDLERTVGPVRREVDPRPGFKGGLTEVILALGSSGAVAAALSAFKAWLNRDRGRTLTVSWTENDQQRSLTISGTEIDLATLDRALHMALPPPDE
jgi:hypothetical protein